MALPDSIPQVGPLRRFGPVMLAYLVVTAFTRPFFWGDKLNCTEANCYGDSPYGTDAKGTFLQRTCAVDFTNDGKYEVHPWGLMHMHGNAYEWCENYYDKTNSSRVLRGGSWRYDALYCRAAKRGSSAPDTTSVDGGFRLVVLETL